MAILDEIKDLAKASFAPRNRDGEDRTQFHRLAGKSEAADGKDLPPLLERIRRYEYPIEDDAV